MRKYLFTLAPFILAVGMLSPARAASIRFEAVSGVTDGTYNIGPYRIQVDGVEFQAMCYDFQHSVSGGQTWQANLLTLTDLSLAYFTGVPGYQEKYAEEMWLYSQLLTANSATARVGIQHAAWLLFTPSAPSAGATAWLSAATAARLAGFPGIDLSTYRVVNSLPGAPLVQGFIIGGFPPASVPEPAPYVATGAGLVLLAVWKRRR
ncbi:MAG: PEP-CTERM sorting domain-containing protein [Acidobacteria bacterium]|nr:PEP-CTERM sorting domain-containing protein [Acidobacteriota bacterium]